MVSAVTPVVGKGSSGPPYLMATERIAEAMTTLSTNWITPILVKIAETKASSTLQL